MSSIGEKGGGTFTGIKLLLCENPLPPIDAAILAAQAEVPRSNYYTQPYSAPLRRLVSEQVGVSEQLIHINAGSELILRQLFDRFGRRVHLLTPTYPLFPEIAQHCTETQLLPEQEFAFDLSRLDVPTGKPAPRSPTWCRIMATSWSRVRCRKLTAWQDFASAMPCCPSASQTTAQYPQQRLSACPPERSGGDRHVAA